MRSPAGIPITVAGRRSQVLCRPGTQTVSSSACTLVCRVSPLAARHGSLPGVAGVVAFTAGRPAAHEQSQSMEQLAPIAGQARGLRHGSVL